MRTHLLLQFISAKKRPMKFLLVVTMGPIPRPHFIMPSLQAQAAVPLTATEIVPIQHRITVQVVKSDAVLDVLSNVLPTARQAAKPLVKVLVPMVAAHFAVELASHPAVAHVPMSHLDQAAPRAPVLLLAVTIVLEHVRWLAVKIACRAVSLRQNESRHKTTIK